MMFYLLTFMTCIGSECVWMQLERPTLEDCSDMKHQAIVEAHQEGKRVTALCTSKVVE